ncbi:MAG: elongation factor P [Actinomycetia bacterium]|nr:elongation factor P [Actinomycetes bacterium]
MKIEGNQIRPNNLLQYKSKLWRVSKVKHVKPGKGGAFAQVEMKEVLGTTKLNERFRSADTVERVRVEEKDFEFLYAAGGDEYVFMDSGNYDQITLMTDLIGEDSLPYLVETMKVIISFYEDNPIAIALPDHVDLLVAEADAVVKGQTASSSYKPAVLENGVRTLVPPYIESGTRIVVNTSDGSFVERAKG